MLTTELLVTTNTNNGVPISQVHRDILTVLEDALKENVFTEFIPEVVTTSYLGPNPEAVTLSSEETANVQASEHSGGTSMKTLAVAIFSLGCALILLKLVACSVFPATTTTKKKRESMCGTFDKIIQYYKRKRCLPTCSGPPPSSPPLGEKKEILLGESNTSTLDGEAILPFSTEDELDNDVDEIYNSLKYSVRSNDADEVDVDEVYDSLRYSVRSNDELTRKEYIDDGNEYLRRFY